MAVQADEKSDMSCENTADDSFETYTNEICHYLVKHIYYAYTLYITLPGYMVTFYPDSVEWGPLSLRLD